MSISRERSAVSEYLSGSWKFSEVPVISDDLAKFGQSKFTLDGVNEDFYIDYLVSNLEEQWEWSLSFKSKFLI
jgi:hypothetical protein